MKKYTNICKRKKKYLQITSQNRKSWFSFFCCCILSLSESLQHTVQPHQTSVIQAEFLYLCSDVVFFIHPTSFTDAESNP